VEPFENIFVFDVGRFQGKSPAPIPNPYLFGTKIPHTLMRDGVLMSITGTSIRKNEFRCRSENFRSIVYTHRNYSSLRCVAAYA